MRWIFASLAAANIVILVYFLFADNHQIPAEQPISKRLRGNLMLLSEKDHLSRRQQTVSTPKQDHMTATGETLCTLIGPFATLLRAEYFTERLAALDVAANIKELSVSTGLNHWVYLKPEVSRKEALRRLSELQKKGVDSYVIPTGNLANGISLGIYSSKERAIAMQERVTKHGYSPEIAEVPRQRQQIWVFLTTNDASAVDEETWLSLMVNEQGTEKRQNICSELMT